MRAIVPAHPNSSSVCAPRISAVRAPRNIARFLLSTGWVSRAPKYIEGVWTNQLQPCGESRRFQTMGRVIFDYPPIGSIRRHITSLSIQAQPGRSIAQYETWHEYMQGR